jgi:hypothetical protein
MPPSGLQHGGKRLYSFGLFIYRRASPVQNLSRQHAIPDLVIFTPSDIRFPKTSNIFQVVIRAVDFTEV